MMAVKTVEFATPAARYNLQLKLQGFFLDFTPTLMRYD
jgi:hypothetical protein